MGNLKNQALRKDTEDIVVHELTDQEYNYIKMLNLTLQYHTFSTKLMTGFLYYVCTTRLGYKNGVDLQFELDFAKDDKQLTVKLTGAEA
jgi:hypothetical protein